MQLTPASSRCVQVEVTAPPGQLRMLVSVPVHRKLFKKMGPVPCPYPAFDTAVASGIITGITHCASMHSFRCQRLCTHIICLDLKIKMAPSKPTSYVLSCTIFYELTEAREASHSADHTSILWSPWVITHCAPGLIDADLHATLTSYVATHQTHSTMIATNCKTKMTV